MVLYTHFAFGFGGKYMSSRVKLRLGLSYMYVKVCAD